MPFVVQGTGDWNKAISDTTHALRACSVVHAANYVGSIGTIGHAEGHLWRLDRQSPPKGKTNLQIQRNGASNPSTAACVIVPDGLADKIPPPGDAARAIVRQARISELTRAIHHGLNLSCRSHRAHPTKPNEFQIQSFEVSGGFSA